MSSCLVLLLETQLKIFVTPDCPATRLSLAHRVLAEETTGDTNGFYDVLRSRDGKVIGIRYTVGAGFDSLLNAVPKLPYAQVKGRQQSMELFSQERGNVTRTNPLISYLEMTASSDPVRCTR